MEDLQNCGFRVSGMSMEDLLNSTQEQKEAWSRQKPRAVHIKDSHPELAKELEKMQQTEAFKQAVEQASKASEGSQREVNLRDFLPAGTMEGVDRAIKSNPRGNPCPSSDALKAAQQGIKACLYCGRNKHKTGVDPVLKRCSRCKAAYFCDDACQKNAWSFHKKDCRAPA